MAERLVDFPSRDGIRLEGLLEEGGGKGFVILLHPHPLYGGEMRNHVLKVLKKVASEEGYSTLRFNFRGVGRSEGSYGEGIKEQEDLRGALDFLNSLGAKGPFIVAGYSFGSIIASRVAPEDDRIEGVVFVSPPLSMDNFSSFRQYGRPKLIIAGDRDFVCPMGELERFYSELPEPKMLKVIEGCDHFYSWGMHVAVSEPFREFLQRFFSQDAP